jgi:hypothetical protein
MPYFLAVFFVYIYSGRPFNGRILRLDFKAVLFCCTFKSYIKAGFFKPYFFGCIFRPCCFTVFLVHKL